MKRIKYQYQIIRFVPDRVSEEFVNVGVVMYSSEHKFLQAEVIDKYRRVTQFFGEVNGAYLLKTLKFIKSAVNNKGKQLKQEILFELPSSLESITNEVLPKDDSALVFTKANTGLDLELEKAFTHLKDRYIREPLDGEHRYTDKEVWTKIYRKFFEQKGIANKLHERTIKTSTDQIKFDLAYKNGHWNCIEPVNFELKYDDSIREKVFKLVGKLDALGKSNEPLEYHVLAHMKQGKRKINEYVLEKLNNRQMGNASVNVITEKEVDKFLAKVEKDLEH